MKGLSINNLWVILDHYLDEEVRDFEENHFELKEGLKDAIFQIQDNNTQDHIVYNLLRLKDELQQLSKNGRNKSKN